MKNIPISLTSKQFLQSLQSQVGSKEVAKNTTDILSFASRRHKTYRIKRRESHDMIEFERITFGFKKGTP